MNDTTRERVHGLADAHAADLASLETLAGLAPDILADDLDGAGVNRNTHELLADLIDAHGPDDATEDPIGAWLNGALDAWHVAHLDIAGGLRSIRHTVVLLSTGGPHVEVSTSGGDAVHVAVAWGETAGRTVRAPELAARLAELAEAAEEVAR